MSTSQLKPPSPHINATNLNISSDLKKRITESLSKIENFGGFELMYEILVFIYGCIDYPHTDLTRFHTTMAHFSDFKEKYEKYIKKTNIDWTQYITTIMAFALQWNKILFDNNSKSGKELKASLSWRIEKLEVMLQEIDKSQEKKSN